LTSAEVSGAVAAFAADYGHRDAGALSRVLAAGVTRYAPDAIQRGRAAVLAEYVRQFHTNPILAYDVSNEAVTAGWVGRATLFYTVRLKGGGTITGNAVFGVTRSGGRAEIGLIVTEQT
jgi:hypothetical protein